MPHGEAAPKTPSLLPSAPFPQPSQDPQITRTLTVPPILAPLLPEEPLSISFSKRSPKSQSRQKWSPSQALLERATPPHTYPCQARRCRDQSDTWRGAQPVFLEHPESRQLPGVCCLLTHPESESSSLQGFGLPISPMEMGEPRF